MVAAHPAATHPPWRPRYAASVPKTPRADAGPCVYVLRCADGTLYTGATTDLDRRLALHNAGKASRYTRSRLPVELAWTARVASWSAALREERRLKALPRAAKLAVVASTSACARTGRAEKKGRTRPAPRGGGRGAVDGPQGKLEGPGGRPEAEAVPASPSQVVGIRRKARPPAPG